jgi:hypothetical protein
MLWEIHHRIQGYAPTCTRLCPHCEAAEAASFRAERVDLMGTLVSTPVEMWQVFGLNVHIAGNTPQNQMEAHLTTRVYYLFGSIGGIYGREHQGHSLERINLR